MKLISYTKFKVSNTLEDAVNNKDINYKAPRVGDRNVAREIRDEEAGRGRVVRWGKGIVKYERYCHVYGYCCVDQQKDITRVGSRSNSTLYPCGVSCIIMVTLFSSDHDLREQYWCLQSEGIHREKRTKFWSFGVVCITL